MLRVANTGATIVVDPLGRITARLAEQEVALIDAVPANRLEQPTLYGRLGDLPFFAAVVLGLLFSLFAVWRERRRG